MFLGSNLHTNCGTDGVKLGFTADYRVQIRCLTTPSAPAATDISEKVSDVKKSITQLNSVFNSYEHEL